MPIFEVYKTTIKFVKHLMGLMGGNIFYGRVENAENIFRRNFTKFRCKNLQLVYDCIIYMFYTLKKHAFNILNIQNSMDIFFMKKLWLFFTPQI